MLIIKVEKNNLEKALKIYKSKVIKSMQMSELNKRTEFVKKSVKKREQVRKAKFIQKMKDNLD